MSLFGVADIGTYSIKTLIGELDNGVISLVGVGKSDSEGVRNGRIIKPQQAGNSLSEATRRAEEMASENLKSLYLGVGGKLLDFTTNEATISITSKDRIVGQNDINRLMDLAGSIDVGTQKRIISTIPQDFRLDGQEGVSNPLGLQGRRLDMTATLVTINEKSMKNYRDTASRAGLKLAGILPTPVCLGDLLLTEEEYRRGKLILDFGMGKTELIVFKQGQLVDSRSFSPGGKNLTKDLAAKFNITPEEAREVKHEVDLSVLAGKEVSTDNSLGEYTNGGKLDREKVLSVLSARLKEIIEMIFSEVRQLGHDNLLSYGIKVTGGNARLRGLMGFFNDHFEPEFEIGRPKRKIIGIEDVVENPIYGNVLALLSSCAKRTEVSKQLDGRASKSSSLLSRVIQK
ncbi:MAG: cell division protein FtsA, partial [Candidatus Bipolaricaulota bacterium]